VTSSFENTAASAVFVLDLEFLYRPLNYQLLKHDTAESSLPKLQTKL